MSVLADAWDRARGIISQRRTAYVRTFTCPPGQEVLEDLARFCRANETTFNKDARAHAVAEGRREVWLRIQKQLKLTDDQLWALRGAGTPTTSRSNEDG